jgi:hypothetical protein
MLSYKSNPMLVKTMITDKNRNTFKLLCFLYYYGVKSVISELYIKEVS